MRHSVYFSKHFVLTFDAFAERHFPGVPVKEPTCLGSQGMYEITSVEKGDFMLIVSLFPLREAKKLYPVHRDREDPSRKYEIVFAEGENILWHGYSTEDDLCNTLDELSSHIDPVKVDASVGNNSIEGFKHED